MIAHGNATNDLIATAQALVRDYDALSSMHALSTVVRPRRPAGPSPFVALKRPEWDGLTIKKLNQKVPVPDSAARCRAHHRDARGGAQRRAGWFPTAVVLFHLPRRTIGRAAFADHAPRGVR